MKKLVAGIAAFALVAALALVGCASGSGQSSSSSGSDQSQSSQSASASSSAQSSSASASAQSASASSASQSSGSVKEGTVKWTDVGSADEAAQGAGFDHFAIPDTIQLRNLTFKNPTFSYAGGVAQAFYEEGAAAVYVRKADGKHTAPLTDRDKVDFDIKWIENLNGVDVTLYGDKQGEATVIDWNIGTEDYTVTYQGLGGDEMTMTSDEAAAIVKNVMDADAAFAAAANDQGDQSDQSSDQGNDQGGDDQGDQGDDQGDQGGGDQGGGDVDFPITADQAAALATSVMGGTATDVQFSYSDLYGQCWYVALDGDDTVPIGAYVNAYGAVYAANKDHNPDVPLHQSITQDQAAVLAAQAFGGYADSVTLTKDSNGYDIWLVAVHNDNGDTANYYVNMLGNAYPAS